MTRSLGVALLAGAAVVILAAGCGEDDFENEPRPAVPVELTGVVQEDKVTVSPRRVGAGAVLITVSNQTDDPHTIILEGDRIREQTKEIAPLDTATIQKTLEEGEYEVRAGSDKAQEREIAPAVLVVEKALEKCPEGRDPDPPRERCPSNDELLLP